MRKPGFCAKLCDRCFFVAACFERQIGLRDLEVSCAAKSRVPTELDLVLGCSVGSGLINGVGDQWLISPT